MPKDQIFFESELAFLVELQRRRVRFMIVGLSAATLQGVPVVTQDVDLWFARPGAQRMLAAVKAVGGFYVAPTAFTPPRLGGEAIKLYDIVTEMHGLKSFDAEYRRAKTIALGDLRLKVLPLERIIVSKRAAKRPKDSAQIPMLEAALAARRARNEDDRPR